MLYMYLVRDGILHVQKAGGLYPSELDRCRAAGWVTYWTTDRRAGDDAERLSGVKF